MTTVEDVLMEKGPDVITAPPTATVYEAAKMMSEANVGSLVVRFPDGDMGIFTERDLLRRVVTTGLDPKATELSEVMTTPVLTVTIDTNIRECSDIMTREHIRHLAVVEEDALVGMISLRNILKFELIEDEERIHELEEQ